MQVPTIPTLSRLSKAHKYSAASMAAAGVGVLAITGAAGNGGTAKNAAATTDTAAVRHVSAWTPRTGLQLKILGTQADAAHRNAKRLAAAKQAAANQTAAKAAAARKVREAAVKRAKERAAGRSARRASLSGTPRQIAREIVGDGAQFQCFSNIVFRESSWNPHATNSSSGAYGLVQALPGSKMAAAGADWRTNPATQIRWGLKYMNSRYGGPCAAWSFWQAHNWY
jgi:hypothetical protein